MGFIDKYPYTDFHELNLDWILAKMRQLGIEMDQFKALNTITFSGVWDITHQYPAWTVVNDNNLGYISIRPVPAGITISNTDYWASIVDYSAELAGIHSDITNLQNDVADIKAELSDGKWVFFGDSYQNFGDWYTKVIGMLGLTNNVDAFYAGASGHGFTVSGQEWETDFDTFCTGRTDLDDFKHVVVVGGLNDSNGTVLASDGAAVRSAIDSFCADVKAKMKNAVIKVAYVGSAFEDSVDLYDRGAANRMNACRIYREELTRNGAIVLENTEYAMCSYSYFAGDGIHPNAYGGESIADAVAEALLNNGSCHVTEISISDTQQNFQTGNMRAFSGIHQTIDNGVSKVRFITLANISSAAYVFDENWVDLGQLPASVFLRQAKSINTVLQVSTSSSQDSMLVKLKIENAHLYVAGIQMATKSTYKTITANSGDRLDFGDVEFIEETMLTM